MGNFFSKLFSFDPFQSPNLTVVLLLAIGFALACLLGYFASRIKLSPILGYLLAGYFIGPYSPGFVANMHLSEQLAEIGVVLMMFGVGLHFKVKDLLNVKSIALPGAIGQTLISAISGAAIVIYFGWSISTGIILGLAISVASTVVLVRMLSDHNLLKTREGHIAVGWLIVEDIITVVILILLPYIAKLMNGSDVSTKDLLISLAVIFLKIIVLAMILALFGHKFVSYVLSKIVRTGSHELFTLAILALAFVLAVGSTILFGISIALGAFIAGIVIGQTKLRDLAMHHSLPVRDAFIAIFFLSVGMLFNPSVIVRSFPIFISILAVILLLKPVVAFLISLLLKYPIRTSVIIAASLAQIGEFSFILSEEAMRYDLISDEAYDIIVACALVSIAVNPLIFKLFHREKQQNI